MDETMQRFPHLIEQIIQKLDDKGLVKSREVSRRLQELVDTKEYPWLRIVKIPTRLKYSNILHLAAEYGQFGMFECILESETKALIRIENPMGLTRVIENNKKLVNENIGSSFFVACYSGRVKIAEMLLKKLDKLKIDNLIKSASAPNQVVLAILGYMESGFKAACFVGHTSIVELLIDKSEKEKNDFFPESLKFPACCETWVCGFHLACLGGHTKVVEMLIYKSESLKLDLKAKDIQGYTGFQLAVLSGSVDVINLIKSKMPCLVI